jgi:hypothetical protein
VGMADSRSPAIANAYGYVAIIRPR